MTAIIKSRDPQAATARALTLMAAVSGPLDPPSPVVDPELLDLRLQAETLAQGLRQRDAEIVALGGAAEAAFLKGEAQGHAAGLAAADARIAERLASLERGIGAALSQFADSLAGLDQLAVLLAHEGLAKILLDPELQAPLVAGAIRKALASLEPEAVLCILVSRDDFEDDAALQALTAAVAAPALTLTATADLDPGACRIRLRLGGLEIGVAHQWDRLSGALQALAAAPGA